MVYLLVIWLFFFNNFAAGSSGIADADLEGKIVQVITIPSTTTFTATVPNAASATRLMAQLIYNLTKL